MAAGTTALTELIVRLARAGHRWTCHREVFVPVIRKSGSLSGIVDLVIERAGLPDLMIEIDSTNKEWSAEKLQFAHRAVVF